MALAQATLPLLPEYGYPPPKAARLRTNDFIMNNEMKILLATFPSFARSEAASHDEQKITALISARAAGSWTVNDEGGKSFKTLTSSSYL